LIWLPVDREARSVTLRFSVSFSCLRFSRAQRDHWDFCPSSAASGRRETDSKSSRCKFRRRIANSVPEIENFAAQEEEIAVAIAKIDSEKEKNAERRFRNVGHTQRDTGSNLSPKTKKESGKRSVTQIEKEKEIDFRKRPVRLGLAESQEEKKFS